MGVCVRLGRGPGGRPSRGAGAGRRRGRPHPRPFPHRGGRGIALDLMQASVPDVPGWSADVALRAIAPRREAPLSNPERPAMIPAWGLGDGLVTDAVEIDLAFTGLGWADCRLRVGEKSIEMSGVSYCTDALGDLVRVAGLITAGHASASFSFDGEPREWRWVLKRYWRDDPERRRQVLSIQVLGFPDMNARSPESEGALEFEAECDPDDFAWAVQQLAERVWNDLGPDGYAEVWGDMASFPSRALAALRAALALPPEPTIILG